MAERAGERLLRLLGMITYLDRHGGVPVEQVAEQFGVSAAQVVDDVDTLWMTGTPGYYPHDLIDFDAVSYEAGVVRLTESRGMTRPLRLGTREAVALVAALRAMEEALGPSLDPERAEVLSSALAKLTAATGEAAGSIDVRLSVDGAPQIMTILNDALRDGRRLRLQYVNANDEESIREVDPLRLVTDDERTSLVAWCYRADDERQFRVDRVLAAELLDVPVHRRQPRPHLAAFRPDPAGGLVTLHVESQGRWIAESVPVEAVRNLPDGTFEVDLRVGSHAWLRHLLVEAAGVVLRVDPAHVAVEVATFARAALTAYEELTPPGADGVTSLPD